MSKENHCIECPYWCLLPPAALKSSLESLVLGFAVITQRALAQIMCVDSRHRFILLCWIHLKGFIWSSAQRFDLCKSYLIPSQMSGDTGSNLARNCSAQFSHMGVFVRQSNESKKRFLFVLFEDLNCPNAWHGSAMWLLSGQILHTDVVYLHHSGQQREADKLRNLMTKYRYPQRLVRL